MTGFVACFREAVPVTTCLGSKHSVHLSYTLIGSLDGSCTRFFLAENQNDFSIRPQGCTGMMGFEPTIFRSTGDCFEPLSYTPKGGIYEVFKVQAG